MALGQKHVIQCRCILQQFKRVKSPPFHRFIVFSVIDDAGFVIPKFVQCNNCGVIHKVIDISRSEIMTGREHMSSIVTEGDLRSFLPEKLIGILESNACDLPTWEAAAFIIEHKKWGDFVVLTSDVEGGTRQGKFVKILGESLFKVESFTRDEVTSK